MGGDSDVDDDAVLAWEEVFLAFAAEVEIRGVEPRGAEVEVLVDAGPAGGIEAASGEGWRAGVEGQVGEDASGVVCGTKVVDGGGQEGVACVGQEEKDEDQEGEGEGLEEGTGEAAGHVGG